MKPKEHLEIQRGKLKDILRTSVKQFENSTGVKVTGLEVVRGETMRKESIFLDVNIIIAL